MLHTGSPTIQENLLSLIVCLIVFNQGIHDTITTVSIKPQNVTALQDWYSQLW